MPLPRPKPTIELPFELPELPPEKQLLKAILENAIADAVRVRMHTTRLTVVEARQWIACNDDREEPFSFLWICDHLEISPSYLRRKIKEGLQIKPVLIK